MRHIPARGGVACQLVGRIRQAHLAVDRDAVIVPQYDQMVEPEVAGKRDRLLRDAFHMAAVAGQRIDAMIDEVATETGIEMAFCNRHADGIGETLAQRSGGRLDAFRMAIFRVARGLRAELAEMLELVECHVLVAKEEKHRIEQHRAVTGGKHEAVAIRPMRVCGVEFEEARKQHRGDVGRSHGQARMAGIRLLNGVHAQGPYRIGIGPERQALLIRIQCGAKGDRDWRGRVGCHGLLAFGNAGGQR